MTEAHALDLHDAFLDALPAPAALIDCTTREVLACNRKCRELGLEHSEVLVPPFRPHFDADHQVTWEAQLPNGTRYTVLAQSYHDWPGRHTYAVIAIDATRHRVLQARYAATDELTGLPNRRAAYAALADALSSARKTGMPFSVLLVDLDRFKILNDYRGHAVGDLALTGVAQALSATLREGSLAARWGGEEFLCVLPGAGPASAKITAERLRVRLQESPIATAEGAIEITASIGVATYPQNGAEINEVLAAADSALYRAKRAGRNCVRLAEGHSFYSLAGQVEHALEAGGLIPQYQPIVDLRSGQIMAEEALARLRPDVGPMPSTEEFIEAANQLHLIHRIDARILLETVRHYACSTNPPPRCFVNFSTDILARPKLVRHALQVAAEISPIPLSEYLVIEITERQLLENRRDAVHALEPVLERDIAIAIDDFGSGYSSFQYLADLPAAYLKLEGSLVSRATREPKVLAILDGIQSIAANLNLTTIAEHIETQATAALLRQIGVDWAQGYLFGAPRALLGEHESAEHYRLAARQSAL